MADISMLGKKYQKNSEKLLNEIKPYLVGEPQVWQKPYGEKVTYGEHLGQFLKSAIPFVSGKLRPDMLVFHDFPTSKGLSHIVFTYSGNWLLPLDFLFVLEGRIPRSVVLKKASLPVGYWASEIGTEKEKDDFCAYLSEIKIDKRRKFKFEVDWTLDFGNYKISLDWAMQLIPISEKQFVFIYHQPYSTGILTPYGKSNVKKFLELVDTLQEAIKGYSFEGPDPSIEILRPTLSLLALPEFGGGYVNEKPAIPTAKVPEVNQKPVDQKQEQKQPDKKLEQKPQNPLQIAKERLAKGEITPDEYLKIKELLDTK